MSVEIVRMSSKGQIVIPQEAREELQVDVGSVFALIVSKDMVVLKKISAPSREDLIKDLSLFAKKSQKKLQEKGIVEKDLKAK